MLSENDLRDALQDAGQPRRSLSSDAIVRRGHRRQVIVRSAAGASALGVVGVIGVTGVALSQGSSPSSSGAQPGGQPAVVPAPSASAKATGPGIPIATGSFAPLPSASLLQSAGPSLPPPSPELTVVPAGTARTVTSIPVKGGTVAYSLRPANGADRILLDVAGADGTLTIKVDDDIPAAATKAQWWYGTLSGFSSEWVVYGAVPAGSTHLELYVHGVPVPVATTHVAGATALAFTLVGHDKESAVEGPVAKLTYVDPAGTTVTALRATAQSLG